MAVGTVEVETALAVGILVVAVADLVGLVASCVDRQACAGAELELVDSDSF